MSQCDNKGEESSSSMGRTNPCLPEELKELATALLLCYLRCTKLQDAAFSELEDMKSQIRSARESTENSELRLRPLFEWEPPAVPEIPRLARFIGDCCAPFQKQLTGTDVQPNQNRLALKRSTAERRIIPLLTAEEKRRLNEAGIAVTTFDSGGTGYEMRFKIWNLKTPVLIGKWKQFFQDQKLKALEDFICVWVFRHLETGAPCFVITSRRFPVNWVIKQSELPGGDEG